jgi:hypothetical protein
MRKVVVVWAGLSGLPGVSVHYCGDTDDITTNLATWFTAMQSIFPAGLTWSIPSTGDKISDDSGHLTGAWTGGTAATVNASGAQPHAAGTGTFVKWTTGAVVGTRRLQGRTFLAPIMNSAYNNSGGIVAGNLTTLQNACNTLVGSNKLIIWHRPKTKTSNDGTGRLAIGASVSTRVSSLDSRRY